MNNLDKYLDMRFARLEGRRVGPRDEEAEAARRERVERLLGTVPKLTTGKAMKFTKAAEREAASKAKQHERHLS